MLLGLAAALAAAVLFGSVAVVQAAVIRRRGLFSPMMLAVLAIYLTGWGLHLVAITKLPLYLAQVGVGSSLIVTALVASSVMGEPLQALHWSIVPIEMLHYETSGMAVMMSLLGGMGTFFGPFVGAAVFLLLENLVSLWTIHWQLFVGAVFVVCVLFFPAGIWGTILKRLNP